MGVTLVEFLMSESSLMSYTMLQGKAGNNVRVVLSFAILIHFAPSLFLAHCMEVATCVMCAPPNIILYHTGWR